VEETRTPPQHAVSAVGTTPDEVRGPPGRVVIEGCASPPAAPVPLRGCGVLRAGGRTVGTSTTDADCCFARRCCCLYLQHKGPSTAVRHLVATAMPTTCRMAEHQIHDVWAFANERAGSTAKCSELSTYRACLALQVAGDDPTDAPKRRKRFQRTRCRPRVNGYSRLHAEDALRSILVVRQVRRCMGATNIYAKRYLYVRDRRSPN
jgi:hypothetical protein